MSKTLFIKFRGNGFWAYDVATGIYLKHLIDAATRRESKENTDWLPACIEAWRTIVVSDYGLYLDESWRGERASSH